MDTCIWVYPHKVWLTIEDELRKLSSLSRTNRSFIRSTVRYASTVQYDKQGRIALSQNLIDYAQLKNDALIIGVVNKIEIWNPKLLKSAEKDFHEIKSSEFDQKISAGDIILSGSFIRPIEARKGDEFFADFGEFGTVECVFS